AADRPRSGAHHLRAVLHQPLVGLARTIPFQHREGRVMQGPALTVAEHLGKREDALLPRRQQLLQGKLWRGMEIEASARAVRVDQLGGEGEEMELIAGRHLQGAGLDLYKAFCLKPRPERGPDASAREQERAAVRMDVGAPPGAWLARRGQGAMLLGDA